MKMLGPFLFALIAAFGNAMFAAGQKRAVELDNAFTFVALAAIVCVILTILFAPFFGPTNYVSAAKQNGVWVVLSGVGLFLTYIGFNLLYSRYGASSYIIYAILSIITTSIIVGVLIFKETFNTYHWFAFVFSMATVIMFAIGNKTSG